VVAVLTPLAFGHIQLRLRLLSFGSSSFKLQTYSSRTVVMNRVSDVCLITRILARFLKILNAQRRDVLLLTSLATGTFILHREASGSGSSIRSIALLRYRKPSINTLPAVLGHCTFLASFRRSMFKLSSRSIVLTDTPLTWCSSHPVGPRRKFPCRRGGSPVTIRFD